MAAKFDVTIDVASTTDNRFCTIGFKHALQNASASKAEINALMDTPESVRCHRHRGDDAEEAFLR